ncbi:MAG TPA: hypothetical protein VNL14_09310 [Candidatus Acidoferrales bacterium]|nr:hypothetical protein [Candidatus Acidoferrales bacterium]
MKIAGQVAVVTGGASGLGRAMAVEVREFGISANAIHPGGRANIDGRGGQAPEVVVPLVCFLASQNRPEVTGQVISAKKRNEASSQAR